MERLKMMKENLMNCVQGQIAGNLERADAKELGEAVDMIKDLSEAIYYCTITEAMEKNEKNEKSQQPINTYYYTERYMPLEPWDEDYRDMDRIRGRMYYGSRGTMGSANSGGMNNGNGGAGGNGGTAYYQHDPRLQESYMPYMPPSMTRDYREGKSPVTRKMYMEGKEMHKDKASQMKDLEKYMQELSTDITEMIQGASPEEKQILQTKIAALSKMIV